MHHGEKEVYADRKLSELAAVVGWQGENEIHGLGVSDEEIWMRSISDDVQTSHKYNLHKPTDTLTSCLFDFSDLTF